MIDINELRRLAQRKDQMDSLISRLQRPGYDLQKEQAIQEAIVVLQQLNAERDALYAKVETAENDAAHQNAIADSALRVAEGWERKCGELRAALQHEADCVEAAKAEIESLRAKIAEMEKQESVAAQHRFRHPHKNMPNWTDWWLCAVSERPAWEVDSQGYEVEYRQLYALPGAQPKLDEIKIALQRALELGKRETWTGARKHRSREDQREEQQCWDKVWTLLDAKGENK